MKAFPTGSQVYGNPNSESDIDLVVFLTPRELELIRSFADSDDRKKAEGKDSDSGPQFGPELSASLRFGKLNLLVVTDPLAYAVWLNGTKALTREVERSSRSIPRDVAIQFFDSLRRAAGLFDHRPTIYEAMEEVNRQRPKRGEGGSGKKRKSDKNIQFDEGSEVEFPYRGATKNGIWMSHDPESGCVTVRVIEGKGWKEYKVDRDDVKPYDPYKGIEDEDHNVPF